MWLFQGRSYQMSRIPRLITLTETLTKPDITKTESNNCFIEHCFKEDTVLIVACTDPSLTLLLEIMHCAGNVQISRLSMYHNSYYYSKQIFLSFHWPRAHHVTCKSLPTNNGLLMCNAVQLCLATNNILHMRNGNRAFLLLTIALV